MATKEAVKNLGEEIEQEAGSQVILSYEHLSKNRWGIVIRYEDEIYLVESYNDWEIVKAGQNKCR